MLPSWFCLAAANNTLQLIVTTDLDPCFSINCCSMFAYPVRPPRALKEHQTQNKTQTPSQTTMDMGRRKITISTTMEREIMMGMSEKSGQSC
ncbi:hypothetical protein K1719_033396 [Acacia pycnantha]|nr:hypothetical protein K1719_033396 [Acacia pycnantha]